MLKLDPLNMVFMVVNILVLYALMKKFLFKPLNRVLEERQALTDKVITDAKTAKEEAEKLKDQNEKLLKETEKKQGMILSEAREKASLEYERIVSEAGKKAEEITEDADRDAEKEHERMLEDARKDITDLVVDAGSRISLMKSDPEGDRALYDEFLESLDREENS